MALVEDCDICQRHAEAFEGAATDTERRMLVVVWRHHDLEMNHPVIRYLYEDEGLVTADLR